MKDLYGPRFRALHWCTEQMITTALAQMDLTASQGRIIGFIARAKRKVFCNFAPIPRIAAASAFTCCPKVRLATPPLSRPSPKSKTVWSKGFPRRSVGSSPRFSTVLLKICGALCAAHPKRRNNSL